MLEAEGDLWTYPAEYRCVTTNGVVTPRTGELVMGAGVALQAKRRFPGLPRKLGSWVRRYGNRPFVCKQERLITFPTKWHWREDSPLTLVLASASLVAAIADKFGIRSVAMPRPGCGNGGLDWDAVRPALAPLLDDRFVAVFGR